MNNEEEPPQNGPLNALTPPETQGKMGTYAIVGIAFGGALLVAVVLGLIMHLRGKKVRQANAHTNALTRQRQLNGFP